MSYRTTGCPLGMSSALHCELSYNELPYSFAAFVRLLANALLLTPIFLGKISCKFATLLLVLQKELDEWSVLPDGDCDACRCVEKFEAMHHRDNSTVAGFE